MDDEDLKLCQSGREKEQRKTPQKKKQILPFPFEAFFIDKCDYKPDWYATHFYHIKLKHANKNWLSIGSYLKFGHNLLETS